MDQFCYRRIRIHMPERSETLKSLAVQLLPLVEGVLRAAIENGRVLVVYDNRKIQAWQIVQLADRGLTIHAPAAVKEEQFLVRARQNFIIPAVSLSALGLKRLVIGRSPLAENFVIFELATLVSVFSGYPALRKHTSWLATRLGTTDDRMLASLALGIAVLRESTTVFIVLFLLNFTAYHKHRQTLVAIAKAGEQIAAYDRENRAPEEVLAYESQMTRWGFLAASLTALLTRDPLRANAMMLALNPRLGSLASKYALNQAEIIAHEDCRYLPLPSGEKIYRLEKERAVTNGQDQAAAAATMQLSRRLRAKVKQNLRTARALQLVLATIALNKGTIGEINRLSDAAVIFMLLILNKRGDLDESIYS